MKPPNRPVRVCRHIEELAALSGPLVLAIGVFDGLHLGHRAVVERARQLASESEGRPVVVTFDPHPIRILRPEAAPRMLVNTEHKLWLLGEAGVRDVLVVPFDDSFCRMSATDFAGALIAASRPLAGIVVGESWRFGCERAGDLALLQTLGRKHRFRAIGVPPVEVDGQPVSSTRIRGLITAGDLDGAERLLGRRFSVLGTVVEGDHLGKKLGFPTANIRVGGEQFPPNGVYATAARFDAHWHPSVTNLGWRPTIRAEQEKHRLLETHLLTGEPDLYGREIEVRFDAWLRGEQTFDSLDSLRTQIARDAEAARRLFRPGPPKE